MQQARSNSNVPSGTSDAAALIDAILGGKPKYHTKPDGKPVLQCEGTNARILYFLLDELYKDPLKPKEQAEL
jgi:hypothetical protein